MSAARQLERRRRREHARLDLWAVCIIGAGLALGAAMAMFWPT